MAQRVHEEDTEREHDDEQQVPEGTFCPFVSARGHHGTSAQESLSFDCTEAASTVFKTVAADCHRPENRRGPGR
ncbi:hypothetical protein GCM10011579_075340 [Streptomyces albiflavescens]|uniref:Uncharacterized protein n=1 Tax=Streptomyces albiflavescens TaxID=1623582 RepID=A0A917YDY2_9ACTN|nr:hypothetical protein GCM10011579_075340 [Streptomyces albiflavescens]